MIISKNKERIRQYVRDLGKINMDLIELAKKLEGDDQAQVIKAIEAIIKPCKILIPLFHVESTS